MEISISVDCPKLKHFHFLHRFRSHVTQNQLCSNSDNNTLIFLSTFVPLVPLTTHSQLVATYVYNAERTLS